MLKVRNLTSNRSGKEVANQFIITDGNKTTFQSYESPIAEIDEENRTIKIFKHYNYSKTTGKYRNQFFDEMNFSELADTKGLEAAIKAGNYKSWKVEKVA